MANEIKAKAQTSLALFGDDVSKGFENMTQDDIDRKSTRLNSSHSQQSRMPSSA